MSRQKFSTDTSVQFHWTSAYNGFGMSSLDVDVAEMSALSAHLRANGTKTVVVMGHSTGSQNVIHYLTSSGTRTPVDGGIMQAPVSDREHFGVATDAMSAAWRAALPQATALVAEGKGETILSGDDLGLRITAYRLHSFLSIAGDDDYFSSDLPTEPDGKARHPLSTSFGALRTPALALFSEKDEFAHIPDPQVVLDRWVGLANGHLSTAIVPGASHAVNDPAHQPALVAETLSWLEKTFK